MIVLLRGAFNGVLAVVLVMFFGSLAALSGLLGRRESLGVWCMRNFGQLMLRGCGVRVTASGLEHVPPDGGFVLVTNHESHFDPPLLLGWFPRPLNIVAKRELFRIPFLGQGMRGLGLIEVDRQDHAKAVASMEGASNFLRDGGAVLVFAEGHRTETGELQPFKKGGFVMALQARVPIVPAGIAGTRAVLPSGGMCIRPGRVHLAVGAPIAVDGLAIKDRDSLLQRTHARVAQLRDAARDALAHETQRA